MINRPNGMASERCHREQGDMVAKKRRRNQEIESLSPEFSEIDLRSSVPKNANKRGHRYSRTLLW